MNCEKDNVFTSRLIKAGEILEIKVLDHIIITQADDYYSFSDSGALV